MAHTDSFILTTLNNGIQKVVLNKPARKNALSGPMYKELTILLNESAKDNKVLIFALTANGDFFSSGNDLGASMATEMTPTTIENASSTVKDFIDAIIMYPKLLIAVVNGPAIGIASTILGIFDIVYASDKAYFYTPFSSLGLVAEGCSSYTFPRLLGHSKAGDMLYLGYKMNAQEAKKYGLVSKVYNHDSLEEVWDYLNNVSKLSSESILATKRLMSKCDKIVDCSQNCNSERISENGDLNLNLNLEDELVESVEYIPCPEFQFSATACYICNGYYGPCFEEPVCATCHAFLFPNDIDLLQVPIFSEKTDDEDSGNDEPTDLYYNHERRTSQQQQNSPQSVNPNIPNIQQNASNHNMNISRRSYAQYQNAAPQCNYHALQNNSNSNSVDKCMVAFARNASVSRDVNLDLQSMICRTRSGCHQNCVNGNDRHVQDMMDEDLRCTSETFGHDGQNNEHGDNVAPQYHWNYRVYEDVGEPSRPYNLSERLEILSNHRHIEHEPINEPGLVERLPPEVLLAIFSHLDDISLWSAANVCRRWCGLLSTHVTQLQWKQHVKLRWPLYKPIGCVRNWYRVYDYLASSAPCRTCLAQTSLRSRPSRMEENSWRRNRLRSELKSLRIDPPEGIEAMPLDHMCCHWQATITGPVGSPYEGGLFYLYLQVPFSYPMCPPVVRFLTKILHPNVSRHGDVGIDSIHHNWSLALTISKVLISVQSLLTDPYCQVCMEPELGEMYMNDREKFEEVARAWTWRYAMHDVVMPL